jgi:cytochrome c2
VIAPQAARGRRRASIPAAAVALIGTAFAGGAAAAAAAQDMGAGERAFQKCYACHSVEPGEVGLQGPNLRGVVGRRAGTLQSYTDYSEAMLEAGEARGLVWNEEELDAFLADPTGYLPGTSMAFPGLKDAAERAAVITYLRAVSR